MYFWNKPKNYCTYLCRKKIVKNILTFAESSMTICVNYILQSTSPCAPFIGLKFIHNMANRRRHGIHKWHVGVHSFSFSLYNRWSTQCILSVYMYTQYAVWMSIIASICGQYLLIRRLLFHIRLHFFLPFPSPIHWYIIVHHFSTMYRLLIVIILYYCVYSVSTLVTCYTGCILLYITHMLYCTRHTTAYCVLNIFILFNTPYFTYLSTKSFV